MSGGSSSDVGCAVYSKGRIWSPTHAAQHREKTQIADIRTLVRPCVADTRVLAVANSRCRYEGLWQRTRQFCGCGHVTHVTYMSCSPIKNHAAASGVI